MADHFPFPTSPALSVHVLRGVPPYPPLRMMLPRTLGSLWSVLLFHIAADSALCEQWPISHALASEGDVAWEEQARESEAAYPEIAATARRKLVNTEFSASTASNGVAVTQALAVAGVVAAAVVAVIAVLFLLVRRKPRAPKVHVELHEVTISPGKPTVVQTPSSTKLFVYTAQI